MDDYKIKQYIKQQLTKAGQNSRRIRTDIHNPFGYGFQVDMGIVSNSDNLQLAIEIFKTSSVTKKKQRILSQHHVPVFEIPVNSKGKMMLAVKELCDYVRDRRKGGLTLRYS